jgi:cell division protein FtsI/penicillin-binding protein 2
MARVVAAVANGGTLLTPHVVREVRDKDGRIVLSAEPRAEGSVGVSEQNLAIMRDAMRQAVTWGTASDGGASIVSVAGKTGTAEFGQQFADGNYLTHAWFSGFAPYENPEIAVTVFLEQGVGATNAAPLASHIFQYYFEQKQQQAQASPDSQQGVTP